MISKNKKIENSLTSKQAQKGFALILVLLFTAIILIIISAIALAIVSDIKLTDRSKIQAQAYNLARSGIDDGWTYYLQQEINGTSPSTDPSTSGQYNFYYYDTSLYTSAPYALSWATSHLDKSYPDALGNGGFYAYRVCVNKYADCTSSSSGGGTLSSFVQSRGYFAGKVIVLKGVITNNDSTNPKKDTIKIYQTGP